MSHSSRFVNISSSCICVSLQVVSLNQRLNSLLDHARISLEHFDLPDDCIDQRIVALCLTCFHYSHTDRFNNLRSLFNDLCVQLIAHIFLVLHNLDWICLRNEWNHDEIVREGLVDGKLLSRREFWYFRFFLQDWCLWSAQLQQGLGQIFLGQGCLVHYFLEGVCVGFVV